MKENIIIIAKMIKIRIYRCKMGISMYPRIQIKAIPNKDNEIGMDT